MRQSIADRLMRCQRSAFNLRESVCLNCCSFYAIPIMAGLQPPLSALRTGHAVFISQCPPYMLELGDNTFVHHMHIFHGHNISWMMCNNAMLDYNGRYQLPNRPNAQDSGAHIQQCPPFFIIPRTPFQGLCCTAPLPNAPATLKVLASASARLEWRAYS